jgi:hypothetical protein
MPWGLSGNGDCWRMRFGGGSAGAWAREVPRWAASRISGDPGEFASSIS